MSAYTAQQTHDMQAEYRQLVKRLLSPEQWQIMLDEEAKTAANPKAQNARGKYRNLAEMSPQQQRRHRQKQLNRAAIRTRDRRRRKEEQETAK